MTQEQLAERIAQGETKYMPELWESCKKLIYKYVNACYATYGAKFKSRGIEKADLKQEAFFILPEAVEAFFKSDRRYKFTTFLRYPLKNMFSRLLGFRAASGRYDPINTARSLSEPMPGTDNLCLGDVLVDVNADFAADIEKKADCDLLFTLSKKLLDERKYNIIERYYKQGQTLTSIAQDLGCSVSNVSAAQRYALRVLRKIPKIWAYRGYVMNSTYNMGGVGRFKNSGMSCVEWAVIKLDKIEERK